MLGEQKFILHNNVNRNIKIVSASSVGVFEFIFLARAHLITLNDFRRLCFGNSEMGRRSIDFGRMISNNILEKKCISIQLFLQKP